MKFKAYVTALLDINDEEKFNDKKKGGITTMELLYTIAKVKGSNKWYAHHVDFPNRPCAVDGSPIFGTKKNTLHIAATMQGISYKEYMTLRKNASPKECCRSCLYYESYYSVKNKEWQAICKSTVIREKIVNEELV